MVIRWETPPPEDTRKNIIEELMEKPNEWALIFEGIFDYGHVVKICRENPNVEVRHQRISALEGKWWARYVPPPEIPENWVET